MIPDREEIAALEATGLVTVRPHNELPLKIVNYTPKAQYEQAWTPQLLPCRGLVFDEEWNVAARPLPKFFNFEEHLGGNPAAGPLPAGPFTVTEKYDGSLGIVFRWKEHLLLATRGSFHSPQAQQGMEILRRNIKEKGWRFDGDGHTHLFEIIYPANRIVVDYGQEERLQWITSIHTATGREEPSFGEQYGGIKYFPAQSPDELKQQDRANAEGYVLRYAGGKRVKIKFAQYVELHRIVSGLDSVSIWECLCMGLDPLVALAMLPDELYGWAEGVALELRRQHAGMVQSVNGRLEKFRTVLPPDANRKEFAEVITREPLPHLLFLALNGNLQRLEEAVWKELKPERTKPIMGEEC